MTLFGVQTAKRSTDGAQAAATQLQQHVIIAEWGEPWQRFIDCTINE